MPALSRPALLLLASGLFADLLYHALGDALDPRVGSAAHLVVLVGMILVVLSVAAQGLRTGNTTHRWSDNAHAHR